MPKSPVREPLRWAEGITRPFAGKLNLELDMERKKQVVWNETERLFYF
jgi:hypothetical protein